jgi:hypothetical protein
MNKIINNNYAKMNDGNLYCNNSLDKTLFYMRKGDDEKMKEAKK